jgi:hypothetical protein
LYPILKQAGLYNNTGSIFKTGAEREKKASQGEEDVIESVAQIELCTMIVLDRLVTIW